MKPQVAARAALGVAVLFGCAVPLLKERGEPVTRLVFSNTSALTLHAVAFRHGADCTDAHDVRFGGRTAVLDMPPQPWQTVAFRYADSSQGGLSVCTGIGSFRTDTGHEYHIDVGESRGACGMRVTRRAAGSQAPLVPVEIAAREAIAAHPDADSARAKARPGAAVTNATSATNRRAACRADARFELAQAPP